MSTKGAFTFARRIVNPSLFEETIAAQTPAIFDKIVSKPWEQALTNWSSPSKLKEHLKSRHYHNTSSPPPLVVPVEMGSSYMDQSKFQRVHLDLFEVLEFWSAESQKREEQKRGGNQQQDNQIPRLYIAQVDLNDIPCLSKDINPSPPFEIKGSIYRVNIWMGGPHGSSSPCHHDPFQNVLIQVSGRKRVLLYPPQEHQALYPALGTVQKNTSLIDFDAVFPSNVDTDAIEKEKEEEKEVEINEKSLIQLKNQFPLFPPKGGVAAYLSPGDALFIPKGWWHYCSSYSSSISVNYWFL